MRECVGMRKREQRDEASRGSGMFREARSSRRVELRSEKGSGARTSGARGGGAVRGGDDAAVAIDGEKVVYSAVPPRVHPAADAAKGAGARMS